MSTEAVGNVGEDPSPILELNPEHPVGKDLENPTRNEIGRLGHERLLYLNRAKSNHRPRGQASCRCPHPASLCLLSLARRERVRTRAPSRVMATVCSKYADSDPSDVQTVHPSGLI
jgi:hypothetical protein